MLLNRKLKMGMVGGGPGAFIGEVHRKATRMDGHIELAAGAFDINPRKSRQMGHELLLDSKRVYGNYEQMIERELKLPEGERIDFVSITTPNNWHFPIARDFLKAGFHVMCEKPMTFNVKEAKELQTLVKKSRKVFGLMHNYTGYPMVKLARDLVRGGELGKIRKIIVQYPQGWLSTAVEKTGSMQAAWRTDPKQSGGDFCQRPEARRRWQRPLAFQQRCQRYSTCQPGFYRRREQSSHLGLRRPEKFGMASRASQLSLCQRAGWACPDMATRE